MNQTRLDSLIDSLMNYRTSDCPIKVTEVKVICKAAKAIFENENTVLDLNGPINICGDVHGQLNDLVKCLQIGGFPLSQNENIKWLFLGDYVDRGPKSVEVICLLFALKIRYPNQIYLIRGNHESPDMTEIFGFALECYKKLQPQCWTIFCDVFEYLPLAAIVSKDYFCVHGGISPQLEKVQQIRDLKRPLKIPPNGLVTDLVWSDPSTEVSEFSESTRGETYLWGIAPAKRFLRNNKLKCIIRGHQVANEGFEYPFKADKSVITMFTASNYTDGLPNKAAFLIIDQMGNFDTKVLPATFASTAPLAEKGRARTKKNGDAMQPERRRSMPISEKMIRTSNSTSSVLSIGNQNVFDDEEYRPRAANASLLCFSKSGRSSSRNSNNTNNNANDNLNNINNNINNIGSCITPRPKMAAALRGSKTDPQFPKLEMPPIDISPNENTKNKPEIKTRGLQSRRRPISVNAKA